MFYFEICIQYSFYNFIYSVKILEPSYIYHISSELFVIKIDFFFHW